MRVKDLMTTQARTCSEDDSLSRVAQIMWDADIGFLPVLDGEQRLVGVVTDRDVCMAAFTQGVRLEDLHADNIMTRDVAVCRAEDSIGDMEEIMRGRQVRRIPVTDPAGRLAGVVTLGDLARSSQRSGLRKALTAARLVTTLARIHEPRRPAARAAE